MRYQIPGGDAVEETLERLESLALYVNQHGRNAWASEEVWAIASALYGQLTNGEILPGFEPEDDDDSGQDRKSYTDDQDRDSYTVTP